MQRHGFRRFTGFAFRGLCPGRPLGALLIFGVLGVLAIPLGACSSDRDGTARRLKQLQEELTRVQNVSDRLEERVSALELSGLASPPGATEAAAEPAPAPLYRPRLKVVHLAPGSAPDRAEAEDEARANSGDEAPEGERPRPGDARSGRAAEAVER